MIEAEMGFCSISSILLVFMSILSCVHSQSSSLDASVMQEFKKSLINSPSSLNWDDSDVCNWAHVQCSPDKRVIRIQIGQQSLTGSLPASLQNLTALEIFEVFGNQFTGPVPSLSGLNSLRRVMLNDNKFSYISTDFFNGMTSLQGVFLDNNPFSSWVFPESIKSASSLVNFSATSSNITGKIPDIFAAENFASLQMLHLAFNAMEGNLPSSFSGSSIQSLWLNGQQTSKLGGSIAVIGNMTSLTDVWLHGNSFSGPLPDFSGLHQLQDLSLRDNQLTGPVPDSLVQLSSLRTVNLTNNLLQGPAPNFTGSVRVDMVSGLNSFCTDDGSSSVCDPRVNDLLDVAQGFGYPYQFALTWKGNDPCGNSWQGVTCNNGNVTVLNFPNLNLSGVISPKISEIRSLRKLILSNNNITGTIPNELTSLEHLQLLDVSNNQLWGSIPVFKNNNVVVNTMGNPQIGHDPPPSIPGNTPGGGGGGGGGGSNVASGNGGKRSSSVVMVGSVVGGLGFAIAFAGIVVLCVHRKKLKSSSRVQEPAATVIHPRRPGSGQDDVKITISRLSANGSANETVSVGSNETRDIHIVEPVNMVISLQVLKSVTNNFSEENILGKGGFGTVYKGELHDGTKIAVKRMSSSGVMTEKGLNEFKSEITIVTKVRHRHLVALLGYCLDVNERILVYEYMPQGTVSQYLFHWETAGLKPLEWKKRLTIALDVARGVEYLHGLAQQSIIHRDLKPSNILLGDDMRAKVADFGLVRLVPDGKASVVTRLAGTFGYLAPEYAVTGRVTSKSDVYSFGVILMELITGRRALDESQPEDSVHLVPWFRRMLQLNKEAFRKAIDPSIDPNKETLASLITVAELAGHCCVREPHQRPDMSHAVNVLSSLAELWRPAETDDPEDIYGIIDYDMTLPQALRKWQAFEGMSTRADDYSCGVGVGADNTQTSIPTGPSEFAHSFTSADGR